MKRLTILILVAFFAMTTNLAAQDSAAARRPKTVKVKIFLLDQFEAADLVNNLAMRAVEREVSSGSPIRSALEELLKGATDDENSQLLYSPVSDVRLLAVRVANKTAYASFTRIGDGNPGRVDALRLRKAVGQTLLQFPAIRRVEICLDGFAGSWPSEAKKRREYSR